MELSQLSEILKNFLLRYDLSTWAVVCEETNDRILIQRKFKHGVNPLPHQQQQQQHHHSNNVAIDVQQQQQQQQQHQHRRPSENSFVTDDRRMNHYQNFPAETSSFVGQPGGAFKAPPRQQELQHSQCDSQSRNHPHGSHHPHQPQLPPPPQQQQQPPPPQQQPHSQLALDSAVDCRGGERRNFSDDPVPFTASYHPTSSTNSSTISSSTNPPSSSSSSYDTPSYLSCVLISENREDKFSCRICGSSFSSARECNHHVDQLHAQEVSAQLKVKCNKCGDMFSSKASLSVHHERRHGIKVAKKKCFVCAEILDAQDVKQHILDTHPGALPEDEAGREETKIDDDAQGPSSCDSPTSLSSNSHNWKVRRVSRKRSESEEDPRKKIPCEYEGCRKKFTTIYNKKHHVEAVHLGIKHQCHLCSSSFSQERDRKVHIKAVHFGYKVKCDICGKEFNRASEMRRHTKQIHPGV